MQLNGTDCGWTGSDCIFTRIATKSGCIVKAKDVSGSSRTLSPFPSTPSSTNSRSRSGHQKQKNGHLTCLMKKLSKIGEGIRNVKKDIGGRL